MYLQVATAQDDITGDGTTSNVLIIGELLKQADTYIQEVTFKRFGGVVVRATASQSVVVGSILFSNHIEHFKNCIHSFPA